ncbi:MAG: hypothetical protein WB507_06120 [Solirubrobacterales bacterium]
MFDAAVIVPRPVKAQVISDLGMRCSANEIPDPLVQWTVFQYRHAKPDGWWLAEGSLFEGSASPRNSYGEIAAAEQVTVNDCTSAICIADGRLLVIVSPNEGDEPAIWIAATCSQITVETEGSQGLRGRPSEITLTGNGWTLKIGAVSRVFRNWVQKGVQRGHLEERFNTGQEASLVTALAQAAEVVPSEPIEAAPTDAPKVGEGYLWQPEDSLGGIYRLIRQGQATTATWLVDREQPVVDQVRALEALDWVPSNAVEVIVKGTQSNSLGELYDPEMPPGRLITPFPNIHLVIYAAGGDDDHPIRRYLWPALNTDGSLSLDPGEQIEMEWEPSVREIASHGAQAPDGLGSVPKSTPLLERRGFLTNKRIVFVGRRDPAEMSGEDLNIWSVTHFRWEWIYELGISRMAQFKRSGLLAKKTLLLEAEAFYARLRLANQGIYELRFSGPLGAAGPIAELLQHSVELAAFGSEREVQATDQQTSELPYATITRTATPITGAVPYSIPDQL